MFIELQPKAGPLRNHRIVAASIVAHLGLLAAILLHRPTPIDLAPAALAFGGGEHSYRVTYAPPGGEEALLPDSKLTLASPSAASRTRPRATPRKPAEEHLVVPADAEAAERNARTGSPLGTMIDGPIEGHEVHVAYPVVFPDPPVARAELPRDLQGDVIVEVTIDAQGNVAETRLLQAIGHGIDEKVMAALRQWHFQPATLDGTPVASKHDVYFHFPS